MENRHNAIDDCNICSLHLTDEPVTNGSHPVRQVSPTTVSDAATSQGQDTVKSTKVAAVKPMMRDVEPEKATSVPVETALKQRDSANRDEGNELNGGYAVSNVINGGPTAVESAANGGGGARLVEAGGMVGDQGICSVLLDLRSIDTNGIPDISASENMDGGDTRLTAEDGEGVRTLTDENSSDDDTRQQSSTSFDESADNEGPVLVEELELRGYQKELAAKALEGKNCLIIAATGTGKTHVALSIAKNHLDPECFEEDRKVVFFVPTVALVSQQLKQFRTYMDHSVKCQGLSGEEAPKFSLADLIAANDVLVMTPQIILNALDRNIIESLSVFTLLIFDECHKVMKNHPYNGIMSRYYVDKILNNKDAFYRLPQVVGLTASPGVGQATSTAKAVEHILQLCGNMAATEICTVRDPNNLEELRRHINNPNDHTSRVQGRRVDPFKNKISQVMVQIENKIREVSRRAAVQAEIPNIMQLVNPPAERGSDPYTQFISRIKRATITLQDADSRRCFMACIPQLEKYNNALLINADCRTKDALNFIVKNETEPEDSELAEMLKTNEKHGKDETDIWLEKLFSDIEAELVAISASPEGDNPKLKVLEKKILEFYAVNRDSQGIVFCKTRAMTAALVAWMKETASLAKLNPHNLIGANRPSAEGAEAMTHNKLEDVLKYFKGGEHKVIVATTVAEEGLDVQQCNYVIRYEHVTNDIARVQARGRARADNAHYVLVAETGRGTIERDETNKLRERMMDRALLEIYQWKQDDIEKKIYELQVKAKVERDMATQGKKLSETLKKARSKQGDYELRCVKCDAFGAWSYDLRTLATVHHVTLEKDFEQTRVILVPHPKPKKIDNWEMKAKILCKKCRADWGIKAIYNAVPNCMLQTKSFIIIGPHGQRSYCKQWKDIPFSVEELSSEDMQEMCARAATDSNDQTPS